MFSFAKKLVDRFEGGSPQDSLNGDSYFKNCLQFNNRGYGLRVVKVEPHSAAHQAGLELWFDYIVKINNHELPMTNPYVSNVQYLINEDGSINYGGQVTSEQAGAVNFDIINQEIATLAARNQPLVLDVWNAKGGLIRQVSLPLESSGMSSTGVTLQSQHLNTATYVWRILATHQGSPAFHSGMVPFLDYIIGCDSTYNDDVNGKGLLTAGGEALLSRTVSNYYNYHFLRTLNDNIPITFYVYNHDYDILRPVTVNLNRSWGHGHNRGILGCDVGYGLLHRLPEVVGKFKAESIVDDVLFDSKQSLEYQPNDGSTFVSPPPPSSEKISAYLTAPPPLGAPHVDQSGSSSFVSPPPSARKKTRHTVASKALDIDSYMDEETEKSLKLDGHPTTVDDAKVIPPPPKA